MTEATLEVFDGLGQIRRDFSAQEVESLSPERRERFTALLSASLDCSEAEREMDQATAEVATRVQELTTAEEAHRKAHPPTDRIAELRKVIAAQNAAR